MIFLKRRRFIFWLLNAYLKRWGKTLFVAFFISLLVFLIILLNLNFILSKVPIYKSQSIGIAGVYTLDNLPAAVLDSMSKGLTKIDKNGNVVPDVASSWQIKDNGKTYIFKLRNGIKFSDGKPLTSSLIDYRFKDAIIEKPDDNTIIFRLKDTYSPFLVTVSTHKIFRKGFMGISSYKIRKLDLNGEFVQSIDLYSQIGRKNIKFVFYPTQEALKTAFILGEISEALDLNELTLQYKKSVNLKEFKNINIENKINTSRLVTLFYNNADPLLSDKKIRKSLSYSLPSSFPEGFRTNAPYDSRSWVNAGLNIYTQDLDYAKSLLGESSASSSASIKIIIKSLPQYENVAKEIVSLWKKLGIKAEVQIVEGIPSVYQVFLGEFFVPKDPDQYMLWHSGQATNITNYKNLRIDKLLEDGRKTIDLSERKKIYADFQKYLLDDQPAAFLFFPYTYTIKRT